MADDRPELRVGAHVLVQLGSELVTDAEQAILECVKNAYDADSPGCRIVINTHEHGVRIETGRAGELGRFLAPSETVRAYLHDMSGNPIRTTNQLNPDQPVQRHLHYTGRISIEDAGDGLTQAQLRNSWLVISQSSKRKEDGPKTKTRRGRTPLGDKGLGRLGSMKLGDILLIETAPARNAPIATAQFRWTDCETAQTVDEIPVFIKQRGNEDAFKGTTVSVLGLKDISEWRRKDRVNEITRSLARLISPFEATSTFPVGISLDGVEHSLVTVTDELLSRAVAEFQFRWGPARPGGANRLTATARIRKRLLTSTRSKTQRERTTKVFEQDNGAGFVNWLPTYSRITTFNERTIDPDGRWFIELESTYEWEELQPEGGSQIADPGPFRGAFYFFHLVQEDEVDKAASGIPFDPGLVKDMSGISILRDGFRVRSQGDWLHLSSGMTSGSTYNMRPENTIGYFALTGEWNYGLVEKSDREGFVEDASYRGFELIATACRDFANSALVIVRRAVDEYARKLTTDTADTPKTAEDSLKALDANLTTVAGIRGKAEQALAALLAALEDLQTDPNTNESPSQVAERAMSLASSAVAAIQDLAAGLKVDVAPVLLTQKINQELEDRQEQLAALFESAAVGLSARGLAHELRTHLTEIRKRADIIERGATAKGSASLQGHFRAIRTSCTAIAQAASLIDPMLPRTRALKEAFSLQEFVEAYFKGRSAAYHQAKIKPQVKGVGVRVRTNRPRLLQVLDNLARNSVFWMTRGARFTGGRDKEIEVELTQDGLILSDTGPGVNPRYEDSLFEIFVTGKGQKDRGQGLGLFIATQLLEIDGCSIELLPDRNEYGRRFRFHVDLSAVIESR